MGYSAGFIDKRVTILRRDKTATQGARGRGSGDAVFTAVGCVNASVTWSKGMRPLQEGALEAYDVVMIRMRWSRLVDKDCRLSCDGKTYQVLQLNGDYRQNQIQIIAQEVVQ